MATTEQQEWLAEVYNNAYAAAYDSADFAARITYDVNFGPEYRAKHPYQPNHKALHAEALRLLDE